MKVFISQIDKAHISEATYYRLFEYYLPDNIDLVTYIDADMIVNNPLTELRKNIENLKHSEYILSAKTEILKNESESLAILKKIHFSNCIGH